MILPWQMNNDPNIPPGDDLKRLLSAWQVSGSLPPRFRRQVWQRIARQEAEGRPGPWASLVNLITVALARPALAMSYLMVLLAAGVGAGYWHARNENAQLSHEMQARYVHMVASYEQH